MKSRIQKAEQIMAGKLRVGEDKVYNFDLHTQWDALVGHAVSYVW